MGIPGNEFAHRQAKKAIHKTTASRVREYAIQWSWSATSGPRTSTDSQGVRRSRSRQKKIDWGRGQIFEFKDPPKIYIYI